MKTDESVRTSGNMKYVNIRKKQVQKTMQRKRMLRDGGNNERIEDKVEQIFMAPVAERSITLGEEEKFVLVRIAYACDADILSIFLNRSRWADRKFHEEHKGVDICFDEEGKHVGYVIYKLTDRTSLDLPFDIAQPKKEQLTIQYGKSADSLTILCDKSASTKTKDFIISHYNKEGKFIGCTFKHLLKNAPMVDEVNLFMALK